MKYIVLTIIIFALGFFLSALLDAGCKIGGVMTWHGKECIEL